MDKSVLKQKSSFDLVTFFKGVAIILVVLVHSHQKFMLTDTARLMPRFGQMGCQIFFLLSAFGLCYSFSKNAVSWFGFLKKRISKIYSGFYWAIIIHIVYRLLKSEAISLKGIILNGLFLHGLVPNNTINNLTVRGGWFVGTIVILYALFPLLFKLYNIHNAFWRKIRIIAFPTIIFIFSYILTSLLGTINPIFLCHNNSFMYFSFINQLTPFALGICLYDIIENIGVKKIKGAVILSLIFLALTIKLFYERYDFSFKICPTTMAISMMFLFLAAYKCDGFCDSLGKNKNIIIPIIKGFGKISFQIYLLHSFIVYDLIEWLIPYLRIIYSSDTLWYIILLPVIYALCFIIGFVFNKLLNILKKKKAC